MVRGLHLPNLIKANYVENSLCHSSWCHFLHFVSCSSFSSRRVCEVIHFIGAHSPSVIEASITEGDGVQSDLQWHSKTADEFPFSHWSTQQAGSSKYIDCDECWMSPKLSFAAFDSLIQPLGFAAQNHHFSAPESLAQNLKAQSRILQMPSWHVLAHNSWWNRECFVLDFDFFLRAFVGRCWLWSTSFKWLLKGILRSLLSLKEVNSQTNFPSSTWYDHHPCLLPHAQNSILSRPLETTKWLPCSEPATSKMLFSHRLWWNAEWLLCERECPRISHFTIFKPSSGDGSNNQIICSECCC